MLTSPNICATCATCAKQNPRDTDVEVSSKKHLEQLAAVTFALMSMLEVNFDEPRYGAVCYRARFGDQVKFYWSENHNLHELPDRAAYDSCSFSSAIQLANAGPRPSGVTIDVSSSSEIFFSCSKICSSNDHKVHICVNESLCDAGCRPLAISPPPLAQSLSPPPPISSSAKPQSSSVPSETLAPMALAVIGGSLGGLLLMLGLYCFCCRSSERTATGLCRPPRKV